MVFKLFSIVEEVGSPINGKIQVVRTFEGVRILAGGISQSGWLVKKVWKAALSKLKREGFLPKRILVLGLGGGSVVQLIGKYWPTAKVVGVDVDNVMVGLGRKYFKLGDFGNLEVVISDAGGWVRKQRKGFFDLVLVDLYVGGRIPAKFRRVEFMRQVERLVESGGVVAFNHLYSSLEKRDAHEFEEKLRGVFPVIVSVQPEANIVFVCYKG